MSEFYDEAFRRNLGLVTEAEQRRLSTARVAIAGAGGMGSIDAVALARLGVGGFTIADGDVYEPVNMNRQAAATVHTIGRNKAEATAELVRSINPDAEVTVIPEAIDAGNLDRFLDGADVVLDGLDIFAMPVRRAIFRAARDRDIPVVSAGPIGYGTAWFVQTPTGMDLDAFAALSDDLPPEEQTVRFLCALAGRGPHLRYLQATRVDSATGAAPSVGLATHTGSGVAACEALKLLLGRGRVRPLPWLLHFDPYTHYFRRYRRPLGGRSPLFRLRLAVLRRLVPNVRPRDPAVDGGVEPLG